MFSQTATVQRSGIRTTKIGQNNVTQNEAERLSVNFQLPTIHTWPYRTGNRTDKNLAHRSVEQKKTKYMHEKLFIVAIIYKRKRRREVGLVDNNSEGDAFLYPCRRRPHPDVIVRFWS